MNIHLAGRGALGLGLSTAIAALAAIAPVHAESAPSIAPPEPLAPAADGTPVLPFTDVPPDHWAYEALGFTAALAVTPKALFRATRRSPATSLRRV